MKHKGVSPLALSLLLGPLGMVSASGAETVAPPADITGDWVTVQVERFPENPIIRPGMAGLEGRNINGPTLIKVPSWVKHPLGKYYLYFGDHRGKTICLAYADNLHGPWTIYAEGTLKLEDVPACQGHIASPEILIDEARQEMRMYFHGVPLDGKGQRSYVAFSTDALHFQPKPDNLAPFYLRVFQYGGYYYGLAKNGNISGVLVRSRDGVTAFERGPEIFPHMRHCALVHQGNTLWVFFSRIADAPEQVILTRFDLTKDWTAWEQHAPAFVPVLKPEEPYEGIDFPLVPSKPGPAEDVHQLRDPFVYEEDGKFYLLYSVAGENGIGIAEMRFEPATAGPEPATSH